MNDLDARARAIVDAARDADNPTSTDRERIRRGVAFQIAAGTIAASTAAVAGSMSLAAKVGWVVATVAVVGGGSVGVHRVWQSKKVEQTPRAHVMKERVLNAAASATMPVAVRDDVPALAAPPSTPSAPELAEARPARIEKNRRRGSSVGGGAERFPVDDSLIVEVGLLARAREELRLGRPARALDTLEEYDRRFGQGMLGEERSALAAIATCQAQPGPVARARADAFMRSAPSSPLLERVRETCAQPAKAARP